MRRIFFYILVLMASVWVGLRIAESPGYVLITYQNWEIESTLWFAIIAILLSFFLAYFIVRIFSNTMHAPAKIRAWFDRRRQRKARGLMQQGLRELAEGDFVRAEKSLLDSVSSSENPLVNYLMAANAAQGHNDIAKRDHYLRQALMCTDNAEMAVGLTQAQLQMNTKQLEEALTTLERLHQLEPKHVHVMQLLQHVYLDLEDWEGLRELLPRLKKHKVLPQNELTTIEQKMHLALLKIGVSRYSLDELYAAWKRIPSYLHTDPEIVICYCDALEEREQHALAEDILRKSLSTHWDGALVRRYGRLKSPKPSKQLHAAESWLKEYPRDPDLLICLGQLCLQNKLWGKARSAFESAISHQPSVASLHALGRVYEQLGDKELALNCYRRAVDLSIRL